MVFDKYFGFSEREVKALCNSNDKVSYDELSQWYDGYFTGDGKKLFDPYSVLKAMTRGVCLNYWTETEPMNEISDCIEHNTAAVREDIVKLVSGIPVEVDLQDYSAAELELNTRDEIPSVMVVYGFLSYHDGLLRIPNHELMEKFQRVQFPLIAILTAIIYNKNVIITHQNTNKNVRGHTKYGTIAIK